MNVIGSDTVVICHFLMWKFLSGSPGVAGCVIARISKEKVYIDSDKDTRFYVRQQLLASFSDT